MNTTTLKKAFKDVYGISIAVHMKEHRMEQNHVWNMVNDLEKKVAKRRGLI